MTARLLAVLAMSLVLCASVEARSPVRGPGHPQGSVTACSRYGNGCYTAPVRQGRFGPEMRLKGGTWIDCRGSCEDALREETVDFWDTIRERSPDH